MTDIIIIKNDSRIIIDSKNLQSIALHGKTPYDISDPFEKWKDERNFLWFHRKAGYYSNWAGRCDRYLFASYAEKFKNDKKMVVEGEAPNEKVYFKPHVIFCYNNGVNYIKYFDTFQEAKDFYEKVKENYSNENFQIEL